METGPEDKVLRTRDGVGLYAPPAVSTYNAMLMQHKQTQHILDEYRKHVRVCRRDLFMQRLVKGVEVSDQTKAFIMAVGAGLTGYLLDAEDYITSSVVYVNGEYVETKYL